MIDIHVHLLPGIDDGPRTWFEAVSLCSALANNGVSKAVATPHLIDGVFENGRTLVTDLVGQLRERLEAESIELEVLPGGEIDISSRHLIERDDDLPLLGNANAVLLEMPVAVIPSALMETLFGLKSRGLLPVLAHPERNELLQENPRLARPWVEAGAALQLDGDSLLGVWGRGARRCSESLLREGLIHAMASDAHSTDKRPPRLREARDEAARILDADPDGLVLAGPAAILDGRRGEGLYEVGPNAGRSETSSFFGRMFGARRSTHGRVR